MLQSLQQAALYAQTDSLLRGREKEREREIEREGESEREREKSDQHAAFLCLSETPGIHPYDASQIVTTTTAWFIS